MKSSSNQETLLPISSFLLTVLSALAAADAQEPTRRGGLRLHALRATRDGALAGADVIAQAMRGSSDDQAFAAVDAIASWARREGARQPDLMGSINTMRCQVCWARPKLVNHAKCMKFLAKVCKDDGKCGNTCPKFKKLLAKECHNPNEPKAQQCCEMHKEVFGSDAPNPGGGAPSDTGNDADGDGVPNDLDKFPDDPSEQHDLDGDGIGDNADPDKDGDGHHNNKDAFPRDKSEWLDTDGDGQGNNKDPDDDNDGHADDHDAYPLDVTRWKGNNTDSDGDGVPDRKDKFPNDPKEWADMDGDGKGDNSDEDRDGDGHNNDEDKFPNDPKEWADLDGDGIGDNSDKDKDGDGCLNEDDKYPDDPAKCKDAPDRDGDGRGDDVDAFPDDPKEWMDSDGDGFGDNQDAYPNNPNCHAKDLPCEEEGEAHPQGIVDPATLNKVERGLPVQGYDEHSEDLVEHDDKETFAGDWQSEFEEYNDQTEQEAIARICEENPENVWCKNEKRVAKFAR